MTESTPSYTYLRPEVKALKEKLDRFIDTEVIPAETEWKEHVEKFSGNARFSMEAIPPVLYKLQQRAQQLGLWNLFLPPRLMKHVPSNFDRRLLPDVPLTYREYGLLAESMGRCPEFGAMVCNCSAPDTGNMEVLLEFGTPAQQQEYLIPLLKGTIRSTFLMTEPNVASSDPTNLETSLTKRADGSFVLNGTKWWSTGVLDPRCRVGICICKNDTAPQTSLHNRHAVVIVPLPHPNVVIQRPLSVFGYDHAPFGHGEVRLHHVGLTRKEIVPGSGFQVAQARLGPGRIHHCMRAVGTAQRCYDLMVARSCERRTFGRYLYEHGSVQKDLADCYSNLQAARLLTLHCAHRLDMVGPKRARQDISSIKVAVPHLLMQVLDCCVQIHGGAGVSQDTLVAAAWANMRTLRIADGPDEVHRQTVAKLQVRKVKATMRRSRL